VSKLSSDALIESAKRLSDEISKLTFADPVTHVYNPLQYAWRSHQAYLSMASPKTCQVLFLGMNPGPWGMAQTGVPFGEIPNVRDYLGIETPVDKPTNEHPKRPVEGFACKKSEVSGRRLWGLFAERFPTAKEFFKRHFVSNYCPLVFMESSARNRTPDKLPAAERETLDAICDQHLSEVIDVLKPKFWVGVGAYAEQCFQRLKEKRASIHGKLDDATILRILHPSPASPAANRDWAGQVTKTLCDAGIWGK
jgi:single-strand selective monofunctional uracil DNA glycosylase